MTQSVRARTCTQEVMAKRQADEEAKQHVECEDPVSVWQLWLIGLEDRPHSFAATQSLVQVGYVKTL